MSEKIEYRKEWIQYDKLNKKIIEAEKLIAELKELKSNLVSSDSYV